MSTRKVSVVLEHRFYRVGENVYTALSFPYKYWDDYLQYFDKVNVVARVKKVPLVLPGFVLSSGDSVRFTDIPYYEGPKDFFTKLPFLLLAVTKAAKNDFYFILRSGNIANLIFFPILFFRRRYVREYPGNIRQGIEGVSGDSLPIKAVAWFSDWFAKFQGKFSKANSFVSGYCQSLYGGNKPGYVFSSFNSDEIKVKKETYSLSSDGTLSIVAVGRLEGEKGHRYLLEAMRLLKENGIQTRLSLIGAGRQEGNLKSLAISLGLSVDFLGAITNRGELFSKVVACDVFVIPSLTEGMPRSLLEAMAMGMPCVGTTVGGIPEVLDGPDIVSPRSASELEKAIEKLGNEKLRSEKGKKNRAFIVSKFGNDALRVKRKEFWGHLYE